MKQKHWQVSVFDKTSEIIRDDTFYTTDTEAYLVFELIDEDFSPDSAMVTVYNIYGTALINASVEVANGIVRYEMPKKAIRHSGGWRTQAIFTKDNEDYTTRIIEFDVGGHLLDNKKPHIVEIENWNSFIEHAGELIDDWEQLEEIRQANEQQRELAESARQTTFETNESTRQSEFETNETSRQTNELVREEAESNRQSTFEENELARESAESVRVSNEAERILKDSERDSKIEAVEGLQADLISGAVDSAAVQQHVEERYGQLEEKYAPKLTEVTTQLAQTADKTYAKSTTEKRPLVSFYLDDGYETDYTVVFPKAKSLSTPVTICLHNDSYLASKDPLPTERRNELLQAGWEIHGHTVKNQSLPLLTYEEQLETMRDNKEYLEDLIGEEIEGFCYPRGETNANSLKAARKLFKNGLGSTPGINDSPIDTYFLHRDITDKGTEELKRKVDKIKSDGEGWLVFYAHTILWGSNPTFRDNFFQMMEYVSIQGVETVTVKEAMEVYENTLDIGDLEYSEDYLKVGSDGSVDSSYLPIISGKNEVEINAKRGIDFSTGKTTIDKYTSTHRSDIPFDNGIGTLFTNRLMEKPGIIGSRAFQRFESINGTVVERNWNTPTGWTEWLSVGNLNTIKTSSYKESSPITDFPRYRVTSVPLTANDSSGFPERGIGTLTTSRLDMNDIINFQMYFPYNKGTIYRRFWTNDGWSRWSIFPESISHSETHDFGSVDPKGTKTVSFTVPGVLASGLATVNFMSGLAGGVIPFAYITANNTVAVRLVNVTDNSVTVGSRTIKIIAQAT